MKPVQEKWDIIKNAVITDYGISQIAVKLWIDPMEYYSETNDTVTIMLPKGTDITVTEANEGYNTTFTLGEGEAENVSTKTFRLSGDTSLDVINRLDTPIPTGVFDGSISIIPALLALLFLAAFMFVLIRKYKALYC